MNKTEHGREEIMRKEKKKKQLKKTKKVMQERY